MEPYHYRGLDGQAAYLAGATQVLTSNFSFALYNATEHYRYVDVDADVYDIGEDNEIPFMEAIKSSLRNNWCGASCPGEVYDYEKEIDEIDFEYEHVDDSFEDAILNCIKICLPAPKQPSQEIITLVKKYYDDIKYFQGKEKAVYQVTKMNNMKAITRCYTYMIFAMYLIEFEESLMLFCFGTNE